MTFLQMVAAVNLSAEFEGQLMRKVLFFLQMSSDIHLSAEFEGQFMRKVLFFLQQAAVSAQIAE